MRCCAWLTGIDRHALHVSVCEQAGVACEALLKVEPVRSRRLKFLVAGCITQSRLPVRTGGLCGSKEEEDLHCRCHTGGHRPHRYVEQDKTDG
jgi:hypothetical protein